MRCSSTTGGSGASASSRVLYLDRCVNSWIRATCRSPLRHCGCGQAVGPTGRSPSCPPVILTRECASARSSMACVGRVERTRSPPPCEQSAIWRASPLAQPALRFLARRARLTRWREATISFVAAPHPSLSPYACATGRGGESCAGPYASGTHRISSSPRRSHCCERGEGRVRGSDTYKHIVAIDSWPNQETDPSSVGATGGRPSTRSGQCCH